MTSKPRTRPAQRTKTAQPAQAPAEPREVASEATSGQETATPQRPTARAGDGRPKCNAPGCILPEFLDGIGVCGGHYATQRGYANKRSG